MSELLDPRLILAETLLSACKQQSKFIAISCDSASGAGLALIKEQLPSQFIESGIAEQNAIGVCAGLASMGFIPIITAITPFITMRCYEQIRDEVGYANQNVKILGSSSGLAFSTLGSTHQALEDMAIIRTIPNMIILNPGDGFEVKRCLEEALNHVGPVYIRLPRHRVEDLLDASQRQFAIGQAEVIAEGSDITCLVTGVLSHQTKVACEMLRKKGLSVGMVNYPCVKPLPIEALLQAVSNTKLLVSIEEHCVNGGFGTMVSEVLSQVGCRTPLMRIGVNEGAVGVGPYHELLHAYELDAEGIYHQVYAAYQRRNI
jgi:transketolase